MLYSLSLTLQTSTPWTFMPVGLEQQRAAVGMMARSAAPKPSSPVGPQWNKLLRNSDPMAYKACVVFLMTVAGMVVSSVKKGTDNMKEMIKEVHGRVCGLASNGKTHVVAMRLRPRAVVATSLLMILLCGHILQLHCHDYRVAGSFRLFFNSAMEAIGDQGMLGVSEGTSIVFVTQMLLMIAGDVEPNPGPENLATLVNELHEVRDEWYNIGLQLNVKIHDLKCIQKQCKENHKDCLREMLTKWLESALDTAPVPDWQRIVCALSSPAVDRPDVAQRIRQTYCTTPEHINDRVEVQSPPLSLTKAIIEREMESLENEFEQLKDDVFDSIQSQSVDVFKVRLTSFKIRDKEYHMEFMKKVVKDKATISDIWVELNDYFNFLNYTILQHILTKFKNMELQVRMDKYKDKLHTFFRKTRVCDFVQCWPMDEQAPEIKLKTFVVKSKKSWDTCTLEELDNLKGRLSTKLLLPDFALILKKVSEGCIVVTYYTSIHLVEYLQTFSWEINLAWLADSDIERITVDGIVDPWQQYTTILKYLYTSRGHLNTLSGSKPRDLFPFRLARVEKQILSSSDMDRFTRETLCGNMDDVIYRKSAMELTRLEAMKDGSQPQVVLIEGPSGVGKTTFAWEQCRQWAEGKVLGDYSIVLLLPLRDNNIRQIRSLPDLFQHSRGQVREELSRRVAESGGKGCLIWLEGWDELPSDLHDTDSFFGQLVLGIRLPAATIFITSRPWATRNLINMAGVRLSQRIELLSLAMEEVDQIIEEISLQSTTNFTSYIESNPMIRAAMYTPISAAILDQVFRSAPHNPPATVTQLYSAYVLMKLEQHLSQHPKYSQIKINVRTLADLPEEVMGDLLALCHLAYEGVSQQMIVFSNLPEGVSTLGLLQTVPQVYDKGEDRVSYNFLHYTVQEYLAALHLSHLPSQQLLSIIDTNYHRKTSTGYNRNYYEATKYRTTFQFLAGITNLEPFPINFLIDPQKKYDYTMYRLLYESQNQSFLASVLGSGKRELKLSEFATVTDYFAAGYCLAHSSCRWNIVFSFVSIDDVAMKYFSKGCNHQVPETGISSKLVSARFWYGSITGEGVKYFLTVPNSLLQHIQNLDLSFNKLDRRGYDLLAEGVRRMPCLERLNLSYNSVIGCGHIIRLVSSLHMSKLRELDIRETHISDPDFGYLANYIHSTSTLEELRIGQNEISVESMDSLCRALRGNSSIRRLDIRCCALTIPKCAYLGRLLRHPLKCQIEILILSRCRMTSDGVRKVMRGLRHNHTLKELDISSNQIGWESVDTVSIMLTRNSSMERLNLSNCGIDSRGGILLGAALERNKTLRYLDLSENAVGDGGAKGLCDGLDNNFSLEQLDLRSDLSIGLQGEASLSCKTRVRFNKRYGQVSGLNHPQSIQLSYPLPETVAHITPERSRSVPKKLLKSKSRGKGEDTHIQSSLVHHQQHPNIKQSYL